MSKVLFPPVPALTNSPNLVTAFLAGSIEMGKAVDWQTEVGETLSACPAVGHVYNPRRADWNASWEQSINHPEFNGQVNWEVDHIERSTVLFFHFEPGTMSPISLLELGYALGRHQSFDQFSSHLRPEIIVNCPDGFWRQGNVEIMVDRAIRKAQNDFIPGTQYAGVQMFKTMDEAKHALIERVWSKHKVLSTAYGFFAHDNGMESQREKKIPLELRGTKIPKGFELPEDQEPKKKGK